MLHDVAGVLVDPGMVDDAGCNRRAHDGDGFARDHEDRERKAAQYEPVSGSAKTTGPLFCNVSHARHQGVYNFELVVPNQANLFVERQQDPFQYKCVGGLRSLSPLGLVNLVAQCVPLPAPPACRSRGPAR